MIISLMKHSLNEYTGMVSIMKNGKMDWDGSNGELHCNKQGSLSIWINDKLNLFSNHTTIIDTLFRKLNGSENEQAFVFEYFSKEFEKPASEFNESEINLIKRELKKGNKQTQSSQNIVSRKGVSST